MADKTLAAVLVADNKLEMQELPLPAIGDEDGLLRVEACGICGSDITQLSGGMAWGHGYPVIPGHEIVGRIEKLGRNAAKRWNVQEGDLVAVEPFLPCGGCETCLTGNYNSCTNNWGGKMQSYGFIGTDVQPKLWGGYAQHMYLHRSTLLHKLPQDMAPNLAALFNPLGGGLHWTVTIPDLKLGDTVVILSTGQRGLAGIIAAREAGAGKIIATGRRDGYKLELARALGADVTVNVAREDLLERVKQETGGRLADVVVDMTPEATQPVLDALNIVRVGGTIVLAGTKGNGKTVAMPTDTIMWKDLTIRGAIGSGYPAYKQAIRIITSGKYPLERMTTHRFPLHEAALAVRTLAGQEPGQEAMCIAIEPWLKERVVIKGQADLGACQDTRDKSK